MTLQPNTLHLGDCLEVMKDIEDHSVDAVICDLPYGSTNCRWDSIIPFEPLWAAYKRVCKPNAAIVLTASQPFTSALVMSNPSMFKHEWIWEKHNGSNPVAVRFAPMKCHENILVFGGSRVTYNPIMTMGTPYKGGKWNKPLGAIHGAKTRSERRDNPTGSRFPRSVQFCRGERGLHPTQKPLALMEYLIKTYTNEGALVLDNTMGSGTTCVAAKRLNRRFIGIEMDSAYYAIAVKRVDETVAGSGVIASEPPPPLVVEDEPPVAPAPPETLVL